MNIKDELTCKYCYEIYKNPIALNCCGENICKQDIDELVLSNNSPNKFTCPLCDQETTNQSFTVNKFMQKMVENEFHKFQIDSKYKETFQNLKTEIRNLENILVGRENFIYEEICELKRQVDLDREQLKIQIDNLAEDLIQKLDSFQKRFNIEQKTVDLKHFKDLVNSSKKQLIEYESCLNFFSTKKVERDEKTSQINELINILQSEINEAKLKIFSNISLTYSSNVTSVDKLFGKLIIKVCLN